MSCGGGWGKLLDDRPPTSSLLEVQKYVRARLEKNWLPRFLASDEFAERQRPRVGMDDAVEDVMMQRKKKSQAIWRVRRASCNYCNAMQLDDACYDAIYAWFPSRSAVTSQMMESKWISSSKDIIILRKALMNPVTSKQFQRFVSIKGENFENDVLFFQEVQKYKVRMRTNSHHRATCAMLTGVCITYI